MVSFLTLLKFSILDHKISLFTGYCLHAYHGEFVYGGRLIQYNDCIRDLINFEMRELGKLLSAIHYLCNEFIFTVLNKHSSFFPSFLRGKPPCARTQFSLTCRLQVFGGDVVASKHKKHHLKNNQTPLFFFCGEWGRVIHSFAIFIF